MPETSTTPSLPSAAPVAAVSWHRESVESTFDRLTTSPSGLSTDEAASRLADVGPNILEDRGSTPPWRIMWGQVKAVMVLILIAAAVLSLLLGKLLEAGAIGGIVVLFVLLGFFQEYRAERAIAALRAMSSPSVTVVRDGRSVEVAGTELVPGDVVRLDAGSVVPADLRLVETAVLRVQEAALTGESAPVDKHADQIDEDDIALADRRNLAFAGTEVTAGRGVGVVTGTGMRTELGRIAGLLLEVEDETTPLQRRLDRVGLQLAGLGVIVAGLVALMGAIGGVPAADLVLTAISVAVAVIPEGLPAVVTFTLALGAQRMLRRNALIRKLPAVETLGAVSTICTDKTGTLTENRMTVTVVDVAGQRRDLHADDVDSARLDTTASDGDVAIAITLAVAVLCNDATAHTDEDGSLVTAGDPTETALLHAAHRSGIEVEGLRTALPRRHEQPFDSTRKRMSTLHGATAGASDGTNTDATWALGALPSDRPFVAVKGAVDGLLEHATHVWDAGAARPIDDELRARIVESNDAMAGAGMRVLGVAVRVLDEGSADPAGDDARPEELEEDLMMVGLLGMIDPPRSEARVAVATCRSAGIRTVMITGDHPLTAGTIAADLGISTNDRVVTGSELDRMPVEEFAAAAREVSVFARVSPEHKLRIVEALQSDGERVAMTGDGVNDAPALKRSDIGVAMGITGTDVSKEAADMVLRDDNFATIVHAVEEGRVIYENLRRFVSFAVAGNLGKIIVMLLWPIPFLFAGGGVETAVALLPLQLLWLNLMTDGLLGLSMGVEPAAPDLMQRPPLRSTASIWADGLGAHTAIVGAMIGVIALAVGFGYERAGAEQWQTMLFTTLALLQVAQALGTRPRSPSSRWRSLAPNRLLFGLAALVVALQLLAVATPLRRLLDLDSLSVPDLAVAAGAALAFGVVLRLLPAPSSAPDNVSRA